MTLFFTAAVILALLCLWLGFQWAGAKARSAAALDEAKREATALEAKAQSYQQKLKALSDSSGAGMIMLDDRARVIHANSAAERFLGAQPDSMVGHALLQATLSSELQEFALQAIASSRASTKDFHLGGGDPRIFRASVYPLESGLSGLAETMLVLVDVTEIRRLETVRRDFVANVSHELRTPLASIRAMAETLQDGAFDDQEVSGRFLETIIREADRLTRIADDLLILADAESKPPAYERFDVGNLVSEVAARFQPRAEERGVDLACTAEKDLPMAGTRDQVEQVFVNLLDNAIKYTPAGGRVDVDAKACGASISVSVKDTGIGIMQDQLPRLFERFYRVDKARSRESGGTGLGLSIVKNIVEAHGGEVGVSSEFNHGSTFVVTLPKSEGM